MLFGIQFSQDVKLSDIGRSLKEDISLIRTEKRLSRNLNNTQLEKEVMQQLVRMGSSRVQANTVLALDLSDIRKEYAQKMEHLATVRSSGNRTTEVALGRLLWAAGLRGYRKQWPVVGKPDFAWPGLKIAVFVDGCFWHGCTRCKHLPRTHTKFWRNKIEADQLRDRRVSQSLRRAGWGVIRVKECAVFRAVTLRRISRALEARRSA